jgi:hypothetical protein
LRSYAKEIERLLLWCIHVGKVNISSLHREHLSKYQDFLKNPTPKKLWCGPNVGRQTKDGAYSGRNEQPIRFYSNGDSGFTRTQILEYSNSKTNHRAIIY